jgi:hypothetical protein
VPCDLPHPDVEPERIRAEVRIRAPKEGDAFASPLANDAPLWVEFQVDAPYDAFLQPDELVQAWLEVPGDTALAARPRQSFAGDRQWVVLWEGLSAQGVVKIDSKVHDFRVPLNTFRLTETKADVRVHLALPRHSVKARDAKVTVVLDEEPPKILRYVVESPVAKGADVPVSLELSDLSGIDRVLFGFVKNDAALLDEKDKLAEIPSADLAEKSELEFAVPTKEAKPEVMPGQKYYLAVRVWDRVGHTSQKVMPVTIAKPAAAAKLVETAGTITGQVLRRGHLYDNWTSFTVKLLKDGRPIDEVKGREDGTFQFKDVPPGAYTIEAEGFALDRLKGSGRVTVTGGPASVKIDAQPK